MAYLLVWSHAEYIKLHRSLRDDRIFNQPPQTVERYLIDKVRCQHFLWILQKSSFSALRQDPAHRAAIPAVVHWSTDEWKTCFDTHTRDTGLGMHFVDLPTDRM
jgi:glucoamylase